eukprot:g1659.t1 g1659   contig10:2531512-2532573(+)
MKLIQFLTINLVALTANAGSGTDLAQCDKRTFIWLSPSLCTDTSTAQWIGAPILSAPSSYCEVRELIASSLNKEVGDEMTAECRATGTRMPWESMCGDEEVDAFLAKFMTLASLARGVEMQAGHGLCDADTNMPWDIVCVDETTSVKLVHRTQPVQTADNFEPSYIPVMPSKKIRDPNKISSRFGLPREKVRQFMNSMKSLPKSTHLSKIPAATLYA